MSHDESFKESPLKAEFQPFDIGNLFHIVPPGKHADSGNRINLRMERGAFGSGEHETTRCCLELLEELPVSDNMSVLDLGSGTGILAIAALKLGAAKACCVDIEAEAVANCQHNCTVNGVENRVRHLHGTLMDLESGVYDLILANIYGDILLDVAEGLVRHTAPGAYILLSGILWEYNFDVRQRYQALGCELLKNCMLEEFSSVLLRKPGE